MKFGFFVASLALVACANAPIYEDGPPVGGWNPGGDPTGSGAGYGYGLGGPGTGGAGGDVPIDCDDSLKRCAHEFSYASQGESSVEVRGDFAADGWTNGVPMTLDGATWKATVDVPWNTDVQYKFVLDGANWITDPANPTQVDDGFGGKNSLLAGLTCTEFTCAPPLLGYDWRDATLYFVLVDRFADGNPANNGAPTPNVQSPADYQGGDLEGVRQKIEEGYFDDLGFNTLWLSVPIDNADVAGIGDDGHYYSGYHGYWPKDLSATESRQGSLAELKAVVDAAHAHDIKVIVDYAMNHVHATSPVYQQHPDWFWPNDNGSGGNCVCGQGCSWDGAEAKKCWFRDYLPDFNFTNATARDFSVDNAMQWIADTGIDGFRLDAVKHIEDSWILDLRSRVTAEVEPVTQQHFYMVGETFTGDKGTIAYYVDPQTKLDGQFDFPMRLALVSNVLIRSGSMNDLDGFLAGNDGYYGAGVMSTFVGNHDVPRVIHFAQDNPVWTDPWAGGKERAWSNQPGLPGGMSAFERLANAYTILFTLPGIPLVYYGDEIGLPGAGDPDNRRFMQWSGLSAGQTFLKNRVATLNATRAAHPALRRGARSTVFVSQNALVYKMTAGSDVVYVAINRADNAENVNNLPGGPMTDALDGSTQSGPSVSLPPRTARVLIPN